MTIDGQPSDIIFVPPTVAPPSDASTITIPDWVPPKDTGQPNAGDLNDLSLLRKQTFAARNTIIPIPYGRDRIFGQPFVIHVDENNGHLYVAYSYGQGEITGYETIYIDSEDKQAVGTAFIGLKNRGWENGDDSGWNTGGSNAGTVNSTVSRTGTFGLNILSAAGGPNRFSDRIPSPPEGTVMRLKAHAQRNAVPTGLPDADCSLRVRTATTVGGSLTISGDVTVITTALQGTSGFQLMEITWVVPAGIVEYVMDLGESGGTQGSWDIDDMSTEVLADDASAIDLSVDAIEIVVYRGEPTQPIDSLLESVLTGYVDTLPDTAYMVIKTPQGSTRGFPRVEAVLQGRRVFDLRHYNRLYDVNADPQFTTAADPIATAQWFTNVNEAAPISDHGWTEETADPSPAASTYAQLIDNDDATEAAFSKEVPVDSTKDYTVTIYVKQPSGDRQHFLLVSFEDSNGDLINNTSSPVSDATGWASIGTYHYYLANATFTTSWVQHQFDFGPSAGADGTIPTGAVSMRIGGLYSRDGAVGTNTTTRISDNRVFLGLKETEQSIADLTTWVFSTNPAICFRDMIDNFTGWDLLDQGVADLADYNDELISGVKRREIGLTLNKPMDVEGWVKGFRTYMGAFIAWEGGKIRVIPNRPDVEAQGGAVFDGTTDTRITMGNQVELNMDATQDFTLEFKFKTSNSVVNQFLVGKKGFLSAGTGYVINLNSSINVSCTIRDGATLVSQENTTVTPDDDQWHHAAMTVDRTADEMILYVDGVGLSPTDISTVTGSLENSSPFNLAERSGGGGNLYDGLIDEIRVWNDVRTPAEIVDNINKEIKDPRFDSSLVGYWKLNEETSETTAVDSSRSLNDGTISGAAIFGDGDMQIIPDGVAFHIGVDDIVKDSLTLTRRTLRSVPNSVAIDYEDSSGSKWHTERVQADSARVTSGAEARRLSRISLPGIHNASQAKREATERLNWYLSDLECDLSMFDEGWQLQHGSIVAVTHPIGLDAKLFRLRRITAKSGRWTLDLVEYDPAIYSDEVIADPTTPDTNLGDPLSPPTVNNLSLTEELFTYKNGLTGSRVRATWNATKYPFLSQYLVEGYVNGIRVWQTFTSANDVVTPGVEELVSETAVTYEVRVYIQSPFAQGDVVTDTVSILGKLAVPGNVPTISLTQTSANSVDVSWGEAVDIDIWRYDLRIGTTSDTFSTATKLDLVDGLQYAATNLAIGTHRFFVKARDSVGNESVAAIQSDITLSVPDAVTSLSGFEVASEVRLNWPAVTTGFVERYRLAFSDIPETFETTLDTVDTLRFQTKDVPEGTFTFKVFSVNKNGVESTTAATIDIEVTSDADAFLADSFDFVNPSLTNMVGYTLRIDTRTFYVTNMGDSFAVSPTDFVAADPLANYHSDGASEWLSETKDFGLLLTGSWNLTHDTTELQGNITIELELSTDDITYSKFTGAAKGAFRFARVRISTFNPPGTATAFVKTPLMNIKVNVVPLEESGEDTTTSSVGIGKTISLVREYTALKEIQTQPKNKTDALTSIVDNIVIGPNTGVLFDGTSFLSTPDDAVFDFGTGDFTIEFWAKNDSTGVTNVIVAKKNTSTSTGYAVSQTGGQEIRATLDDGTVALNIDTTGNAFPDDGQYHHVAVIINRTTDLCKIRIDTVEEANGDISTLTGSMDNGIALTVGARAFPNAEWSGTIDELRIWSDVRTNAEVDDNRQAEVSAASAGLVGYWKMDGAVGATVVTVQDAHANNNDFAETGAGTLTYVDPGEAGDLIQKVNSFDVFIFDVFGQQLSEQFQWKWKAV